MKPIKHLRHEIMDRVKEILTRKTSGGYPTIAEHRVYRQKYSPLSDHFDNPAHLPAVVLFCTHESVERVDYTQDRRTLSLGIECYATGEDSEAELDTLTEQIEILIRRDQTLEDLIESIHLRSTEWVYDKATESLIEGARLSYELRYIRASYSTLPLNDFDQVTITTNLPGGDTLSQTLEITQ